MKTEGTVESVETGEIAKDIKNDGKYYRRHLGWIEWHGDRDDYDKMNLAYVEDFSQDNSINQELQTMTLTGV